jgi:hypothetical protein
MDSRGTDGIDEYPRIPWEPVDSMGTHSIIVCPWILWVPMDSRDTDGFHEYE